MKSIFLYLFCLAFFIGQAQSRRRSIKQNELGFIVGGSYYIGDLNNRDHFIYSKPAIGIFYRLSNDYRSAFRFGLNYGKIGAQDSQHNIAYQQERSLGFTSTVYEFNSLAEFNFTEYRIGDERHRFTLFIFGGLNVFYLSTEVNGGVGVPENKRASKIQMSVPFGVGVKMNLGKNVGLGIEWGPRRSFTDYLDGVSATYPSGGSITNEAGVAISPGPASAGAMRGDPTMKDWYFFYGLNLDFKLPSKKTCHGTGRKRR